MAAFVVATFAIGFMIRDYALKYRQAIARGNKIAPKIVERPMTPVLGSHVNFRDAQGIEHNALVIAVHNPKTLTLAITDNDDPNIEQYFSDIERGASVMHVNLPVHTFSYEYTEEERRPYGVPEQSNYLHNHIHVN